MTVRLGVIGTSWWCDSMYLPAATAHPDAEVVAVAGRNPVTTQEFASRWSIPDTHEGAHELLERPDLDAVIIATPNDSHHELAMAALEAGLHVLCEKPLALSVDQAQDMTDAATRAAAITCVPFTYRFMPSNQWIKRLIDDGYIGTPFHLNLRYFTGFARGHDYAWRFDKAAAGSGVLGDLGSHWLDMARWLFGEITGVSAIASRFYERDPRPDGDPYEPTEDSATLNVRFASGAHGTLQVSAVCHEGTHMGQTHHLDAHGSGGTLYSLNDWETQQWVRGASAADHLPPRDLPVPDDIWGRARRERVHDTYRDVFRKNLAMVGDFVDAVGTGSACAPDFTDGLRVQQLLDAAERSIAADAAMIEV